MDTASDSLEARLARLEQENAKLHKINQALIHRVERGMAADNGNSFTIFQVSAELEHRIQERTQALEKALSDLKASNIALEEAREAIKRQEALLREQDRAEHWKLMEATVNSLRQGIAVFDQEARLLAWNHRFGELARLPAQALAVGQPLPPASEVPLFCPLAGGYELETGAGRVLEIESSPMPNAGFVITVSDVTERKRDEQALRESESKLRLVTDALPALIAYVDKDQVYRFTNKGYEDWFGIPVSQINGRTLREVLGPELYDPRRHFVERALAGQASVFELKLPVPNRAIEYAQATFIPHIGEDGSVHGFYALIQDITPARRAEQVLEQAKEQLEVRVAERTTELRRANTRLQEAIIAAEEANQSKTRFFAAASHDLLQPLNAARLFIASLAERAPPGEFQQLVGNAASSFEAVDELINTLLELSRIDAGAVEVATSHFFADQLLAQLATEFAPLAAARGLTLRTRRCGAVLHSDWVLLGRILRNFLSNAIRYTEHGGLLLGARRSAEGLLIGVWDQGRGIPADKLPSIFHEFQRLPEHSSMCSKGMGLGLAIVERLTLRLKHRLVVRSRYGRGSFFGVVVPYGKAEAASLLLRDAAAAQEAPSAEPHGLTVLLIDNEPAILEGMASLLSGWGCRPLPAASQAEALAMLELLKAPPDAILADYHLDHGATGTAAIRAVAARIGRALPAAIITADRTEAVSAEAADGGWELLTKPVRPARLRALLGHFAKLASPR